VTSLEPALTAPTASTMPTAPTAPDRRSAEADDLILAVDAGTQSIRAALVDQRGTILHLVKTPLQPYASPHPGWAEQDAEHYWEVLCKTTRELLAGGSALRGRIAAATLTTQRLTVVSVDADGVPLRPAIVWLDERATDLRETLPAFAVPLAKATGQYGLLAYAARYSRAGWLRRHEPEIWSKTAKFLYLSGFFTHRLTGGFKDSAGNIVGPVPFDVKHSRWAGKRDLKWRLFQIEAEKLPDLVQPTELLGHVTRKAAEETGLPEGLPLLAASNDKACDIIGSGCLSPERACVSFGTTATIDVQNRRYVTLRPFVPPFPSAIPGEFYSEVAVVRGMWLVSWFRDEFGLQERQQAEGSDATPEELLEHLIRDVPPGSMGLVCHPHWTPGPGLAPATKGAIFGFGDVHTRAHVYRAILEGVLFALKEGGRLIERKTGAPITEIRPTGGGARSDTLMQMTADVFGLPVRRPHTHETSVLGAAMDAAVGLGLYPDFAAAAQGMTRVGNVFTPIRENEKIYSDLYEQVYLKAYKRLLPLHRRIQEITGYPRL
jgi:sugar (pentulose or hexulose) kinase